MTSDNHVFKDWLMVAAALEPEESIRIPTPTKEIRSYYARKLNVALNELYKEDAVLAGSLYIKPGSIEKSYFVEIKKTISNPTVAYMVKADGDMTIVKLAERDGTTTHRLRTIYQMVAAKRTLEEVRQFIPDLTSDEEELFKTHRERTDNDS